MALKLLSTDVRHGRKEFTMMSKMKGLQDFTILQIINLAISLQISSQTSLVYETQ